MIKKAICPNCGAEGTVGRYCEFCGTKIVEVQKHKENASTAKKVILDFKISKEEAIEKFLKNFIITNAIPHDIFCKLQINDVSPMYIPLYSYVGTFNANWSCLKIEKEEYKEGDKTKTREKKYPMNGVAGGNFSFILPNCDTASLPSSVSSLLHSIKTNDSLYEQAELKTFDENSCIVSENGESSATVWRKNNCGDELISEIHNAIHEQVSFDYEDLTYSYTTNGGEGKAFFMSLWIITYTYNGQVYDFAIEGTGESNGSNHPVYEEEKEEIDKYDTIIKNSRVGLLGVLAIFITVFSIGILVAMGYSIPGSQAYLDGKSNGLFITLFTDAVFGLDICLIHKIGNLLIKKQNAENAKNELIKKAMLIKCTNLSEELKIKDFGLDKNIHKQLSDFIPSLKEAIEGVKYDEKAGGWVKYAISILIIIAGILNIVIFGYYSHRPNAQKSQTDLMIKSDTDPIDQYISQQISPTSSTDKLSEETIDNTPNESSMENTTIASTDNDNEQIEEEEVGFKSNVDVMDYVVGNSYSYNGITLRITDEAVYANNNKISTSKPVFRKISLNKGIITARPSISITVIRDDNRLVDNNNGDTYYY